MIRSIGVQIQRSPFIASLIIPQILIYSKTCLNNHSKRRLKFSFQDQLLLNAGNKYCRMLPLEHSAILLIFIKLPFVIKIFVLSIFSGHLRQVLLKPYHALCPKCFTRNYRKMTIYIPL